MQGTFIFAAAVLAEAALSFLGVGVPPYIPSWGSDPGRGPPLYPAGALARAVPGRGHHADILGLNLFGDGLRDLLDPKIRGLATERQRAA